MSVRLLALVILGFTSLYMPNVSALTVKQFASICDSAPGADCSDHPVLHAYVGGALDLLAVLDEETDDLAKLYCKEPKELYDVPTIIRFMQSHSDESGPRNAMLLVVQYFEQNGGCSHND